MRKSQEKILTWLAVAVIAAIFGTWTWQNARRGHAAHSLAPADRDVLYERTLGTLRTTCARANDAELIDYCHQQAEFVLRLSECDEACEQLARAHLSPARR